MFKNFKYFILILGGILKKPVAMLTFYPEMAQEIPVETGGEFVFLVDRSSKCANTYDYNYNIYIQFSLYTVNEF